MINTACALQKNESHLATWPWRGYRTKYDKKKTTITFEKENNDCLYLLLK